MIKILELFWSALGLSPEQRALIARSIWVMGVSGHILWVCGWLAPVGLASPFAQADEVNNQVKHIIREELSAKRQSDLPGLMLDAKQKYCAASGEARRLHFTTYNALRAEYYKLTQLEYPDPPCEDFK